MFKYVLTVKYGKEKRAELEVGDSVFPYDINVRISRTRFKGVLVLETTLGFNELISVLSTYPPSVLERVVPVDKCFKINSNLVSELLNYVRTKEFSKIRFGRYGSLGHELVKEINALLNNLRSINSNKVLHIEPINDEVCVGVIDEGRDKFYIIRNRKIPKTK